MILDLNDVPLNRKEVQGTPNDQVLTSYHPDVAANPSLPTPFSTGVIMRVLHTRTEITIYPSGNIFQKSQSWFENQTYQVKKKEQAKKKEIIDVQKKGIEEY